MRQASFAREFCYIGFRVVVSRLSCQFQKLTARMSEVVCTARRSRCLNNRSFDATPDPVNETR